MNAHCASELSACPPLAGSRQLAALATLQASVGVTRVSDWILVDQAMIDRFADATLDYQYIHVDPVRAAESPFGQTVAHGFLTLSLLPKLLGLFQEPTAPGGGMVINYGFERVRFVNPVRSGSRVRAAFTVTSCEEKRVGQLQQCTEIVV